MERRSTISQITRKQGKTGPLVFVRIDHEISATHGVAIREAQDLVYSEKPRAGAPVPSSSGEECQRSEIERVVRPDAVLLFRFSALTYNSHRIHNDAPYTTEVEGYSGLVVYGPLLAALLLDPVSIAITRARRSRGFGSVRIDRCSWVSRPRCR